MRDDLARIAAAETGVLLTGCVRGANHCDKNLPCQDASLAGIHYYKGYPYVLLAVADGHGAASYTRSELGAHFAVRAAAEAAARWVLFAVDCLEKQPDDWLDNARNEFSQRFIRHLRQTWEVSVTSHLAAFPMQPADSGVEALKPYGTTVALAVVFAGQVFAGAIGDSTVFLVREVNVVDPARHTGRDCRYPEHREVNVGAGSEPNAVELASAVGRNKSVLAGDSGELTGRMPETVVARPYSGLLHPPLNSTALGTAVDLLAGAKADGLGLATDSLASADAVYKWKHKMLPLAETRMVLVSTDGFKDSLADPLKTLADLQHDTETKGFAWLEGRLNGFLARLTEQGVGDDIATVFYFPPQAPLPVAAPASSANTFEI